MSKSQPRVQRRRLDDDYDYNEDYRKDRRSVRGGYSSFGTSKDRYLTAAVYEPAAGYDRPISD